MNTELLVITILFILLALSLGVGAQDLPRFHQRQFAISFWVGPPAEYATDEAYAQIREAGFNVVMGGFGGSSPEAMQQQIDLCQKHGLRLLAHSPGTPADQLPASPAIWGYMLRDEPNTAGFAELATQVAEIRAARPYKLSYINLLPDYANAGQLGAPTYTDYVKRFIDEVKPDVLSMDYYPIFKPEGDGRDGYCGCLAVMREQSLEAGIPYWNFFNAMPYGPHTDPTEDQLRWQIYATLVYGAKGLMYFCYWTPRGGEFPKGGALVTADGRRTRHWWQAQRLNSELQFLGSTLMQLTSTKVTRVKPGEEADLTGTGLARLWRAEPAADPELDLLIGSFIHRDGRRAVLLMNYRFAHTAWPSVEFEVPADQVLEVDKRTGEERPVIDDSPDLEGLQVSLDAGEGRLFLLPASE